MGVQILGNLFGKRLNQPEADVVQIHSVIEHGPAENSFVLVCASGRARYLSWIGYYDIEYAERKEPGCWAVREPSQAYAREAAWCPYGWDGAVIVPTIGDSAMGRERGAG